MQKLKVLFNKVASKKKVLSELAGIYPFFFTVIFIFLMLQYSFTTLDSILYDLWARIDFGIQASDDIVLISMDEESDEFLGDTFPYTYATHVRFFEKLGEDNPFLIAYFPALFEPQTLSDEPYYDRFTSLLDDYTKRGGLFRFATSIDFWGEQLPPERLKHFGYLLAQLNIDNAAFSRDNVCRRAILNVAGDDSLHLWAANRFREKQNERPLESNSFLGSYYVSKADATFSLFRYSSDPRDGKTHFQTIPFHRVVTGRYPPGLFKDKVVLVGPRYISRASDYAYTPFSKDEYTASQLNIHGQIISSLIQDKTVYMIPNIVTDIIAVIMALILSVLISRLKPSSGLTFTLLTMLGFIILTYLLFSVMGLWVNLTHIILAIFIVYYIWVPFRAIGEYQQRFAIQEETKLLKKVDALKQNFISFMSHDLKTPVAKIAGMADILQNQFPNGEEQKKYLNGILNATKELNKFITSILDLTKIESRNLNLKKSSKDLNKLIEGVIDSLRFEAGQNSIRIEKDLAPLYPISMDVNLMNRVVSNLVENSIKYSGENTTISVKTWDDENWVYLEIQDTGVGIAPQDLEYIFDKFYRVKNDASHKIKGSGLGLYLVKYFIELHGGKISVQSELEKGTRFLIKLKNA